jgi:hypothetical protein
VDCNKDPEMVGPETGLTLNQKKFPHQNIFGLQWEIGELNHG